MNRTQHTRLADLRRFHECDPLEFDRIIVFVRDPAERELSQWAFAREHSARCAQFWPAWPHCDIEGYLADPECSAQYYYERKWHPEFYRHSRPVSNAEVFAVDSYRYWVDVDGEIPGNVEWVTLDRQLDVLQLLAGEACDLPHANGSEHGTVEESYSVCAYELLAKRYDWTYQNLYSCTQPYSANAGG